MKKIAILGATGSIGTSTLDLVEAAPERFEVTAVTASSNIAELAAIARRTRASLAVIADDSRLGELQAALAGTGIRVAAGEGALAEAAVSADLVIAAIVGTAGLAPVMAAVRAGRTIGLANKEALVSAGALMIEEARRSGAVLLPIDSEHNAIFQCLAGQDCDKVARLILTASGGPFRTLSAADMARATPAQAVAHPNWSMGAKISVDSATMMNKGLELIEAHHLFALPEERIDIVVHPQSVIHSLVEYADGSMLAQLGSPDMRVPIGHILAWPERMATKARRLDLLEIARLDFEAPDPGRFPALRLARETLRRGGAAPLTLNASNEVAVEAFLRGAIHFGDIAAIVEEQLDRMDQPLPPSIDDVLALDSEVRRTTREALKVTAH
ncbi:1-deoxy-D-xylulose-5-phosphate reductoisomerase [Sphingomonas kaistensis]|uniref:1-deoxy-D-xylulose 5-phosphate reductoisomerase n=1 Tax=Sphingomonas kaistensis TaxID=298708 RepID=A0A7X5Y7N6_9SPHN|nr:1-deoxy-D-xylulose-5-phosphate reductoisomerase [Sphingomonas kaistensis]NJC06288.1 1-deoxy-D-xylulose-5-phosphate reductoisomerase [Sphingomonas kaistensis]